MNQAFICDAIRTPIGRYGGTLAGIRTDDLAALPIKALMARNSGVNWEQVEDVIYGCANQAGEDNRNVARMAALLAGLPVAVPGSTINRLCGSGMDAVGTAARAIKAGETALMIAGGVESMSRAPFVMPKAESAFSRSNAVYDTTIGWRFVNKLMKAQYGIDSMPETADNVAAEFKIDRADQDAFALRSQQRWGAANTAGVFKTEIVPVEIAQKKGEPKLFDTDEHPRTDTTLEQLAKLKGINSKPGGPDLTVTAGNASGVNDGACALLLASEAAAKSPWPDAQGTRGGHGHGRRGAAHHGLRSGAGGEEAAGPDRPDTGADGCHRTQRGLRRARSGRHPRPRPGRRRCPRQSEWRRHRHRPPAGHERRPPGDHRHVSVASHRRPLCAMHHVHRRRPGHRA
jgi:acetyl-CoA acyltransferase